MKAKLVKESVEFEQMRKFLDLQPISKERKEELKTLISSGNNDGYVYKVNELISDNKGRIEFMEEESTGVLSIIMKKIQGGDSVEDVYYMLEHLYGSLTRMHDFVQENIFLKNLE